MPVTIEDIDVREKTVLYRVDYNVPLGPGGVITDDYRITQTVPTLDYLLKHGAKVIILAHLGRPGGHFDPNLSLRPVAKHLLTFFNRVQLQVTDGILGPDIATNISKMPPGSIFMLGNTRFYPEEEQNDFKFAKSIASLGNIYVTDAFGAMHRSDATIVQVPKLMDAYQGLLLAKEIRELSRLRNHARRPFTAIVGGAKLKDKVSLIKALLKRSDYVLVGGAVANTFAKALGDDVGASYVEEDMVEEAKQIMESANGKLVLPVDYVKDGYDGSARYTDVGQKTIDLFKQYIAGSKDIFWNGAMGVIEDKRFVAGTLMLAQALVAAKGLATVAGGDTVGFIERQQLTSQFSFVSTGGGAATAFVAGENLPGLSALNVNS